MRQSAKIRLGGGGINALTKDTILRGIGENITDIDYNNIVNNKLIFTGPELSIENTGLDINNLSCNIVRFNTDLYYDKAHIDTNIQLKLIPNLGIRISDNRNISVDFSDGGWTKDNDILYTNTKIGIGTDNPSSTLHIKNDTASIIIANNINKFKFYYNDNTFIFGNNDKPQFNIHTEAQENSINIDTTSTVNIGYNLNVKGDTNLTSKIFIGADKKDIISWLTDDKNIANKEYVKNNQILDDNTTLRGIGSNITELDYKKITLNKLIFRDPLRYDDFNNTIDIDLSKSGWTNESNIIYSPINSNVGIGTSEPLGILHIGSTFDDIDGTVVISKTVNEQRINKNFKLGYDEKYNFVFGNLTTNNIWSKQFYINTNAPSESLIITNLGNININSNLLIKNSLTFNKNTLNYNLNIDANNNLNIANNIIINRNGLIGIGIAPINDNTNSKLYINGNVKILSDLYSTDIYANDGFFNILTISNLNILRNVNVLSNITTNNINAQLLSSVNINTNNINATRNINALNILSSNSIFTLSIRTDDIICSNNIISINNINGNIINAKNIISDNIETLFNITSCNINIANNLKSLSNIYADLLIYSSNDIRAKNNIYSKNIVSDTITSTISITTASLNSININNQVNITTKDLVSTNITATDIDATLISVDNINVDEKITVNNIDSLNINNNDKITTYNLDIINDITCQNKINTASISSKFLHSDKIGINILEPNAELHIGNNSLNNTSIIITDKTYTNNFKIGYTDDNNFCIGAYYNIRKWHKQISINVKAPDNIINIKESGNIKIGTELEETPDIYKFNIIGHLNATEIYQNGIKILNNSNINTIIDTKLQSYLSLTDAKKNYSTKYSVYSDIEDAINKTENFVTSLLSFNSNIFSNEKRYPYENNNPTSDTYTNSGFNINIGYHINNYIYSFKERFSETLINDNNSTITRIYNIYSSSIELGTNTKFRFINLFYHNDDYDNYNSNLYPSWGSNNYIDSYYNNKLQENIDIQNNSKIIYNSGITNSRRYYGDFIIIEFTNFDFIFSKFRFYIFNNLINNAPSLWRCYVSNDANTWIILNYASNDNNLTSSDYIKVTDTYSYYERKFYNNIKYKYIGFVFNKIIFENALEQRTTNLKFLKLELYGKEALIPLYISSNVLNNILTNYVKNDYINTNIQGRLTVSYPLALVDNTLTIDTTNFLNSASSLSDQYDSLSNSIVSYINSKTDIWSKEPLKLNNIYYTSGTVGIGTTLPNINNDNQLKLNVGGNIVASNINVINNINSENTITAKNLNVANNITANIYQGNGSLLTNINYNNIPNKPNLTNLNNWNITINSANIANCYNILNGNIGIGYSLNASLISKLSVNGNIFSTAIINCTNLQENSINISDKYISITNASNTYLSKSGGIISGSIGIGTTNSELYKLNINGTINTTSINSISFIENGIDISNKYLTILNANSEYLSKNNGGTINNNLIISQNLAIGSTNITDYRLNVNGSIYSSNNISCLNNIIEGGSNLIDKYLTIINASNSYLSINGGSILGTLGIGTTNSDLYKLNINGSLNTTSLYINNNIIDFTSFATNTSLNTILLSYPTLTFLSNNYISSNNFNSTISSYSKTGEDANYLKIIGGTILGDTTFTSNLTTSNLITSNLTSLNQIITSNLTSLNQIITSNLTTSNLTSLNQIITSNIQANTLTTSGKVSIGSTTLSEHLLFINGSLNTTSLYINNNIIDFSSFATIVSLNTTLLSYPTLTYLSNNYISSNNFNSTISSYSKTGEDTNYLKISGGIIINDTTFSKNLFTSNLITSNIINYSNIQTNTLITSDKVSIGSTTLSEHLLFINGSLNATSLYINNNIIDFASFATTTSLNTILLSYPTLTFLSNNYISINNLNSTLLLYSKTGEDANYLKITGGTISGDTTFTSNLTTSNLITSNLTSLNQIITSNIIANNLNSSNISNVNLISSHSIYAINNIGIGTNPTSLYKLNVNGSIYSSNNISCLGNIVENGSNLSDKYLTIENALNNYFLISGGIINNNLGIGTTASQLYKLNVNGSIYSSNNISCLGNIIENGSNLSDKYLTISNASNNYFPINGGSILSNVSILSNLGIGVIANNIYKLTISGDVYISNNILCLGDIAENGINLNNKYLSINGGYISSNLTISSNVGIGTIANNLYKLNVSGTIYSSNDIICNGIIKEGGTNLRDKYLSVRGGNISSNLIIDSNLSIGTNINNLYKLNVNGSIYSSNDIICEGNLKEGGSNLKDKYLLIKDVNNFISTDILRNELANNIPNIQKKYGFRCVCSKPIILNNETYYKHDILLSTYVKTKIDSTDANPYRIFGIKFFSTSAIFNNNVPNKPPTILQYDIYTSYIVNSGIINICAIGFPSNYYLNKITAGDIFLLKTTNYNYISILSRIPNLNISCIISDFLF